MATQTQNNDTSMKVGAPTQQLIAAPPVSSTAAAVAAAALSTNDLKQPSISSNVNPEIVPVVSLKDDEDQNQMKVSAPAPQEVHEPTNNKHTPAAIPSNLSTKEVENLIGTQLGDYVKGCTSKHTCGGYLKLSEPVKVTYNKTESITIQVPQELRDGKLAPYKYAKKSPGSWSSDGSFDRAEKKRAELFLQQTIELNPLIKTIPRAAFGKGGETVYDTNVRDALQLKAEDYELNIPQNRMDQILNEVKKGMNLQTDIIAEPYSLNVYQVGGKFAKHKDTPRGDDMLGTLVIKLPAWCTGGKMTVSLGSETETYFNAQARYSYSPTPAPDPLLINWCAFFADVDHEIHTVEEGIRITATYLLRRKDQASASSMLPREIQGDEQANRIIGALLQGLGDNRFFPDGGKVGFPCHHLYTNTEVFPGQKDSTQALTSKQMNKLKGRDFMIANAAENAGLSVYLQPYLIHDYSRDGGGDYTLKKFPKKKRCPRYMSNDTIESHFDTEEQQEDPTSAADLWIEDYDLAAKKGAGETEWSADGYFGNEASGIDFYVKACLIIEVPHYSESRGIPVQLPKKKKRKTNHQKKVE